MEAAVIHNIRLISCTVAVNCNSSGSSDSKVMVQCLTTKVK